ncbi:pyridine nucleotide-disulfide oxidoreductase [Bacteriovorax sp. BSW11_IV]|uniref:NAD(P)-binding domain-containing protein n=1 Tax=Bacteriovorax sp. BSW11_IV TaxID=1353529 RepID=UPI00038A15B3|nr:NAD(P)-binding domain-containing protein [Bacteriovorax sp. BSW11_IV]EQC49014.1 pyridine nucleotide-disulfide oxidoreductase [Bacteriovorax sp. BSW11_IV]
MSHSPITPIVIIGAGPAGIATAVEAMNRGYKNSEIVLLEKSGEVGHMIQSKYPNEKPVLANYKERMAECIGDMCITDMTKSDFMDYLSTTIKERELNVKFHEQVEKIIKLKNGQFNVITNNEHYLCDAVFVAIGNMASPRTLGVPVAEEVASKIFYDIQDISKEMADVLVVGGGDSAGEYAKILCERGHKVTLSYRGGEFNRMIDQNRDNTLKLIKEEKIIFLPSSHIKEIQNTKGLPLVSFAEGDYKPRPFHAIVTALGTERPTKYLSAIGIETIIEGEDIFSESKMEGLFFVGDLASGKRGGSINFAFNSGVKAIGKACSLYLDCDL